MNPWEYLNYSCNQSYILWSGLSICNQWHQGEHWELLILISLFCSYCWLTWLESDFCWRTLLTTWSKLPFRHIERQTGGDIREREHYKIGLVGDVSSHHHQARSPTTRFVQTRNICQDRETGVDRCFAGAFQFSKRKSALYSFFSRGGGEFKVVNSTQQLGAYYMMLCGCFSVYQAGKYTPRYDSRGVCVHVFVVVVGIGEYYCDHPIDHLTNSHPILERWIGNWHQKHANLSHEGNLITMPYAKDEGVGCGDGERL